MSAAVEAGGLSVRLGRHLALDRLSFSLATGSATAVLGPNGGGKSTLLRALLGLLPAADGELRVLGAPPGAAPARIGYVPQVKSLDRSFPALARELVVSGLRRGWPWRTTPLQQEAALSALRSVGAEALADKSIAWLSGGELQRVYLARALARRPELLLLDEPASGVDAAGEADMYAVLDAYRRQSGASVVMVTHDWGAALHHADTVLLLSRSLIAAGPPAEVLTDGHLRQAFGHHGHAHGMGWTAPPERPQ